MRKGSRVLAVILCGLVGLSGMWLYRSGRFPFPFHRDTITVSRAESRVNANQSPYTQVTQRGCYDSLPSDDCRRLYDAVDEVVDHITDAYEDGYYLLEAAEAEGTFTEEDLSAVVEAYRADHPEKFWVVSTYWYMLPDGGAWLQLASPIDSSMRDTCEGLLDSAVAEILQKVPAGLSELDREAAIFGLLADRCTYQDDTTTDSGEQDWVPFTAYGALASGRAVCEGYARAMELLCGKVGLSCRIVRGTADGVGHMWNLVRIDGAWYHFDATGMDTSRHVAYFNVTDAVIAEDHTLDPVGAYGTRAFNLPLPAADATAANYFLARGVHIAALDDDTAHAVAQAMADTVAGGHEVFALYIEEGLDFADTVEKLFQGGSYFLGDCVQRANTALDGEEQIDYAAIRYVPCESQRGVSVRLR